MVRKLFLEVCCVVLLIVAYNAYGFTEDRLPRGIDGLADFQQKQI